MEEAEMPGGAAEEEERVAVAVRDPQASPHEEEVSLSQETTQETSGLAEARQMQPQLTLARTACASSSFTSS